LNGETPLNNADIGRFKQRDPYATAKKRQATALKALTHHSGFAARM